jgi:hypothetical protein
MGMISFLKEAGEKLFGKSPEIAAVVAEPSNAEKVAAANGRRPRPSAPTSARRACRPTR